MVPTNSVASKFWELFCLLLSHYLLWLFLSLVRILGTFLPLTSLHYFRTNFIPKRVNLMKHFMIVIYDSRDIWLENCPYYNSRVVIYARKMFISLPQCCFSQVSLSSRIEENFLILLITDVPTVALPHTKKHCSLWIFNLLKKLPW